MQLRAQGFLRIVETGNNSTVVLTRHYRESGDWMLCPAFHKFTIRYGAAIGDMVLRDKKLIDKKTNKEVFLIEPPCTVGNTKILTARDICRDASVDFYLRMVEKNRPNPGGHNIVIKHKPKIFERSIVAASINRTINISSVIHPVYPGQLTPLHYACIRGNIMLVADLVRKGAKINVSDTGGFTALHVAAINGHTDIAAFLIEHGADLEARNNDDSTPLLEAVYNNDRSMVKLLLDKGADTSVRDIANHTPLSAAERKNYLNLVVILKTY
jgi:hypothetical protein